MPNDTASTPPRKRPTAPARATPPPPIPDARPFLFLHIPKTAGTSFLTTLQNLFGEQHVLRLAMETPDLFARVHAVATGETTGVACLSGHLAADVLAPCLDRFRPFTILRHPVARVFSLFRFLRKNPDIEALGLPRGFSFDQFLASTAPEIISQRDNGMTRMLAGNAAFTTPGQPGFDAIDDHPGLVSQAIALLEGIDFGIAEDMPGTHRIIEAAWNIPFALDEMVLNTTELDGNHKNWRHVQAIVERNRLDIALYDTAVALFRDRLAALDPTPQARPLAAGMLYRPASDDWVALDHVPGRQGFHAWFEDGLAWINDGPPARLHLAGTDAPQQIALRLFGIDPDYPFDDVRLHLNGRPLRFRATEREDYWCTLETGAVALPEAINTLSITVPAFIAVRDRDPTSIDTRKLGIAVTSLRIVPATATAIATPPANPRVARATHSLARLRTRLTPRTAGLRPSFAPQPDTAYAVADIPGRRGFHPVEADGFAWLTSTQPARIRFTSPATSPLRLSLRIYTVIPKYPVERLLLRLNGNPITHDGQTTTDQWHTILTEPLTLIPGTNELTLDPSHFISLRLINPTTPDPRYLALALRSLTLLT